MKANPTIAPANASFLFRTNTPAGGQKPLNLDFKNSYPILPPFPTKGASKWHHMT